MDIDLNALEKALASKGRRPAQTLTPGPAKSRRELWDEAKSLNKEYRAVYGHKTSLRTSYKGIAYRISRWGSLLARGLDTDVETVPIEALERLVANGRRKLKNYHEMLEQVIAQAPQVALEANLEGKTTRGEVVEYAYGKAVSEIGAAINRRIVSPVRMYLALDVVLAAPERFTVDISLWLKDAVDLTGVDTKASSATEVARLIYFLSHVDEVIESVNRQIDSIKIRDR